MSAPVDVCVAEDERRYVMSATEVECAAEYGRRYVMSAPGDECASEDGRRYVMSAPEVECVAEDERRYVMSAPEDECAAEDGTDSSPPAEDDLQLPVKDADKPQVKQSAVTRCRINQRERRRMHDLNVAMDALRQVMPYANGPSVRKLSKIATLSLARNYIQMLTKSVEELKHLLDEAYRTRGVPSPVQFQRMTPPVHPGVLNFTSRDFRGFNSFAGCLSLLSAQSPCTGGCDIACAYCQAIPCPAGIHAVLGNRAPASLGSSGSTQMTQTH